MREKAMVMIYDSWKGLFNKPGPDGRWIKGLLVFRTVTNKSEAAWCDSMMMKNG